jgi:hypothetical protein
MRLTDVLIRCRALQDNMAQRKCCLMKVLKAQGGHMAIDRPQKWLVEFEVHQQDVQVLITPSNPANTRGALPDGTTLMQVIAQCDHPNLRWGILEALVIDTLPAQDRSTYSAKVRPDGGHKETRYRGRPAIHCLLGAGRHHFEGGLRHVPAIAGSAHSQAPPISQVGHAGTRTPYT